MKIQCILAAIVLSITINNIPISIGAEELKEIELVNPQMTISATNDFLYNIQKYTGLNCFIDFLVETTIKAVLKLKTRAKDVSVDLKLYSAFDLFKKKARYLQIKAEKLFVKGIPIKEFVLITTDPIYFKKKRVAIPLGISTSLKVDLQNITEVLNNLPKWKEIFKELDLPIPPFGYTKISVSDIKIVVSETGLVEAESKIKSLVNPDSEPLSLKFKGNLALADKKIVINNLESEVEDIFTKDSDVGMSFSKFLEDLINPVFSFHKIERNGLTIDKVDLSFDKDNVSLKINSRLLPEEPVEAK